MAKREKNQPPRPSRRSKKTKLEVCPCGKTPGGLIVEPGAKVGRVSGNCCGMWSVEFITGVIGQEPEQQEALMIKARTAWNGAPRS